ncbi:IS3 family transposase [Massilia forsythiae]|uniref:IS3 family transposase n=1 Tax=Massilia forsythiae TaxID=2728020 RepID=A0A7Z2VZ16_9BURK|nr:IS3 family transposase [Massilia forsythiae]
MKTVRLKYPLGLLCRVFEVSRSGYYAALDRPASQRAQDDEKLKIAIKAAHVQTRQTYGPLRLQPELAAQGFEAGRNRIVRLRRELGLRCKQKRRFKATTNSKHAYPVASNLLEQTFTPTAPDEAWVSDITYVATDKGWLYLAGIKDVFTCEMVGYALGARMTQELTAQALWRAVRNKRPAPGLILHSDRGSQGGFNQSSQHLYREGVYGTTSRMDAQVDRARSNALTRGAVASPRNRAAILGANSDGYYN